MVILIRLFGCLLFATLLICGAFATGQTGKLYWTDDPTDSIKRSTLDGSVIETFIYSENLAPFDIAIDPLDDKVYWIEGFNGTQASNIMRSNLDGSGIEVILESISLHSLSGLAVDAYHQLIYWTDDNTDTIKRANLNGSNVETLLTSGGFNGTSGTYELIGPHAIDVDPLGGKMYWIDKKIDSTLQSIVRANFDGSDLEIVLDTSLHSLSGIAVDPIHGKIYWTDDTTDTINRSDLDGSSVEALLTSGGFGGNPGLYELIGPHSIAVDPLGGKVYWTDKNIGSPRESIVRANLDGSDLEVILDTDLHQLSRIALDVNVIPEPTNLALVAVLLLLKLPCRKNRQ